MRRGEVLSSDVEELLATEVEEETEDAAEEVSDEPEDDGEAEEDAAEDEEAPPPPAQRKPIRLLARVEPGRVYLRTGMGRKQSGSYYTNRASL